MLLETKRENRDGLYAGLIGQTGRGDQQAFETLFHETKRPVEAVIHGILGDRNATEEVASDVFLQIWKKADAFDPVRGKPVSWVLTIARHRAIDHLRSRGNFRKFESCLDDSQQPVAHDDPEMDSCLTEMKARLRSALEALSADQKEVIEMTFLDGFSHSEAARRLNLPLGTLKTRIRLGMAKLRVFLRPQFAG